MASGRMEFHADSIMQHANFSFVLPNDVFMEEVKDLHYYDRPPKTLILLHGLTGTDTDWLFGGVAHRTFRKVEEPAERVAVLAPAGLLPAADGLQLHGSADGADDIRARRAAVAHRQAAREQIPA